MPPKRLSEIPPPADSSSEEDETESEGESEEEEVVKTADLNGAALKQEEDGDEEEEDGDEEEEDEDEDEDEEDEPKSPPPKKPTETPDLDSESTQPSPSLSAFTIKLHKPSQKPNLAGSKRSMESEEENLKKKKSKAAADEDEEPKKGSAIQRLWSESDELAILNGLIRYKLEKGAYPNSDMVAFQEFIKDSLTVDATKTQLGDKIRRLKKKYRTNVERGENGQDLVSLKPHDHKCFELSKKVWDGSESEVKRTPKVQNGGGNVTLGLPSSKQMGVKNVEKKKSAVKKKEEVKTVEKHQSTTEVVENLWAKYPFLGESLNMEGLSDGMKVIVMEKLGLLPKQKLEELEHKWESLKQVEVELFKQKIELVNKQVKLALDLIKS